MAIYIDSICPCPRHPTVFHFQNILPSTESGSLENQGGCIKGNCLFARGRDLRCKEKGLSLRFCLCEFEAAAMSIWLDTWENKDGKIELQGVALVWCSISS